MTYAHLARLSWGGPSYTGTTRRLMPSFTLGASEPGVRSKALARDERQQPPAAARWLLLRLRLRACPRDGWRRAEAPEDRQVSARQACSVLRRVLAAGAPGPGLRWRAPQNSKPSKAYTGSGSFATRSPPRAKTLAKPRKLRINIRAPTSTGGTNFLQTSHIQRHAAIAPTRSGVRVPLAPSKSLQRRGFLTVAAEARLAAPG
jgi:hypothetical protein